MGCLWDVFGSFERLGFTGESQEVPRQTVSECFWDWSAKDQEAISGLLGAVVAGNEWWGHFLEDYNEKTEAELDPPPAFMPAGLHAKLMEAIEAFFAMARQQFHLHRLLCELLDGGTPFKPEEWSEPATMTQWCKRFDMSQRTLRRHRTERRFRMVKLAGWQWVVHKDEALYQNWQAREKRGVNGQDDK